MRIGNDRLSMELDESSALDIGSCVLDGVEIAPGDAVPDDGDPRILRAVGGFMFTCGPDHVRHPEPVETVAGKRYPLHGSLSGSPATGMEEAKVGDGVAVSARIVVGLAQGGEAEIARRWYMDMRSGEVELEDRLTNIGPAAFAPMLMYHMNIGAHLFGDATMLASRSLPGGRIGWRFGEGDGHVFCVPVTSAGERENLTLGPIPGAGGKALVVWFSAETLPHLQLWRNQSGHCDVLGIEPVSHPLQTRAELAAGNLMVPLAPGEHRTYRLGFAFQ